MLLAKLFAGLASMLAIFAVLYAASIRPARDVFLLVTHLAVPHHLIQLFELLLCVAFTLFYFVAARWMPRPLNNTLALVHFVLIALAVVLLALIMSVLAYAQQSGQSAFRIWHFLVLYAGILSFLLGCLVFVVNVGWTAIRMLRAH
jgi:hypothetical protein